MLDKSKSECVKITAQKVAGTESLPPQNMEKSTYIDTNSLFNLPTEKNNDETTR
jgi:hypothetical protein